MKFLQIKYLFINTISQFLQLLLRPRVPGRRVEVNATGRVVHRRDWEVPHDPLEAWLGEAGVGGAVVGEQEEGALAEQDLG